MLALFSGPRIGRRSLLRASWGAGLVILTRSPLLAASEFWNKKSPSDWSAGEIEQLQTRSPWARKVHIELSGRMSGGGGRGSGVESMDRGGTRGSFGGMAGADSNGISDGGGRGGGGRRGGGDLGGDSGPQPQVTPEVLVRWDSAKPVLDATKLALPADLAEHYVLSVTGLPPQMLIAQLGGRGGPTEDPAERQKVMIDRLMHSASLTAKGRDPQVADQVRQIQSHGSLVFGFVKQNLALTTADRDVEFILKLGGLTVKAKFQPKEMLYKGELSV